MDRMDRNVGTTERYLRLATGAAAAVGAMRTSGWQRVALCGVATVGFATGMSQYCPLNEASGRDSYHGRGRALDEGLRDTEIRRHTAMRSALGTAPTTDSGQRVVTEENDVFTRETYRR